MSNVKWAEKKVFIWIVVLVLAGLCLNGCNGSQNGISSNKSSEIEDSVPKRINAGVIMTDSPADFLPDEVSIADCSGKNEYERYTNVFALYEPRMFWGQWVIKGRDQREETPSANTSQLMEIKRGNLQSEVECLPSVIQFGPLRLGVDAFDGFERSVSIDDFGYAELMYSLPEDEKNIEEPEDETYVDSYTKGGRWCRAAVAVKDNQIAFGLFDQDPNEKLESGRKVKIREVAYSFEWNGAELTLHQGEDKAVYIPLAYERDGEKIGFEKAYNLKGGDSEGFKYLSITGENGIVETYLESQKSAMVDYQEDGHDFKVTLPDGSQHLYEQYYYSGVTLTLLSGDGRIDAFDCSNRKSAAGDTKFNFWASLDLDADGQGGEIEGESGGSDKYLYDHISIRTEDQGLFDWELYSDTVAGVIDHIEGKVPEIIDADLETEVPSGGVTNYFSLHISDLTVYVRAVNIYNHIAPLRDCFICSAYLDKTSAEGNVLINDDMKIGEANYSDVKNAFEFQVDRMTSDEIIFRSPLQHSFEKKAEEDLMLGELDRENQILYPGDNCRYIFSFQDDTFVSWAVEIPGLLQGVAEIATEQDKLEQANPAEAAKEMDIRRGIAEKLSAAFADASIDAQIDRETGVITMDSEILFDSSSYELKDRGNNYIDRFSNALLPVILEEDVKKNIKKVEVIGHTDTRSSYTYNLELSEKRASAVMERILENAETLLGADRMEEIEFLFMASGKAFNDPIYDEDGNIDMDASRRVEIKFQIATPN